MRFLLLWKLVLLLSLTSVMWLGTCTRPSDDRPEVLLITLDTTRWDYLSCYGSKSARTPHLDSIAAAGVRFEHAVTTVPVTLPAHASILTGLYPPGHGVRNNGRYRLPDGIPTLATLLRDAGYRTGAVTGAFVLHSQFGLNSGFTHYNDDLPYVDPDRPAGGYNERKAEEVTRAAVSFLETVESEPFFLWVHYFDPHNPYEPPEPYDTMYADDHYAGEIAYVDANVGELLEKVRYLHGAEPLITIVVGDHGEDLGDHGEMSHGTFLYESTMHVPLILSFPGNLPEGITCEQTVSVVDIVPTLIDLLDLPAGAMEPHGRSLVSALMGDARSGRPIYIETRFPLESMGWSPLEGVVLDEWKYIRAPTEELYNLSGDPEEENNLFTSRGVRAERMAAVLDSLEGIMSEQGTGEQVSFDDESRRRLEELGYLISAGDRKQGLKDPKDMIADMRKRGSDPMTHFRQGNFEAAEREFAEALERDPTNTTIMNYRGLALFNLGKVREARDVWQTALDIDPGYIDARLNLGKAHLALGDWSRALGAFDAVLDVNPYYVKALIGRGRCLRFMGESTQAEDAFRRAVKVDPDNPGARTWLGVVRREAGDPEGALLHFDEALHVKPDMKKALREKAMALIETGRSNEAVRVMGELCRLSPGRADFTLDLGYALEQNEEPERALTAYTRAVELDPASHRAHNDLGALLVRMGRTHEAEEHLKQAVSLKEDFPEAHFNLGVLLAREGRSEEAREELSRFLALWKRNDAMRSHATELLENL